MFSRLLRILMFMFFFSFSSLTSFSLHNSFALRVRIKKNKDNEENSNEFDAIKNMFHKRITADDALGRTKNEKDLPLGKVQFNTVRDNSEKTSQITFRFVQFDDASYFSHPLCRLIHFALDYVRHFSLSERK